MWPLDCAFVGEVQSRYGLLHRADAEIARGCHVKLDLISNFAQGPGEQMHLFPGAYMWQNWIVIEEDGYGKVLHIT